MSLFCVASWHKQVKVIPLKTQATLLFGALKLVRQDDNVKVCSCAYGQQVQQSRACVRACEREGSANVLVCEHAYVWARVRARRRAGAGTRAFLDDEGEMELMYQYRGRCGISSVSLRAAPGVTTMTLGSWEPRL